MATPQGAAWIKAHLLSRPRSRDTAGAQQQEQLSWVCGQRPDAEAALGGCGWRVEQVPSPWRKMLALRWQAPCKCAATRPPVCRPCCRDGTVGLYSAPRFVTQSAPVEPPPLFLPQMSVPGSWAAGWALGPGQASAGACTPLPAVFSPEDGKGPDLGASCFDSPGGWMQPPGEGGELTSEQDCTLIICLSFHFW